VTEEVSRAGVRDRDIWTITYSQNFLANPQEDALRSLLGEERDPWDFILAREKVGDKSLCPLARAGGPLTQRGRTIG
jgi:hypothetical protein